MILRSAMPSDLALLRHWDGQPHVIASGPNDDWDWESQLGRSIAWREQLIAEIDGRPVGYLEIIDPARDEKHYWGEVSEGQRAIDIWIGEASDLRKATGPA
ncbi:acetyltransferase (GNAT) family protein [Modicisalibacter xianhensis]|uniref:Acetyltransferase (GNAT) family protein n=1 Tax=Modicisalibacter xianhensis TaxID=442341 RepID=A0A4R8FZS5_9GAMM|nr:GNAT family N-acetyltransferase [Halomonas xianhensis]TDX29813.1 acetyltransferase (GNAT) family protein [Halomonas xianhensis]